jgi:diguanylate cyclase
MDGSIAAGDGATGAIVTPLAGLKSPRERAVLRCAFAALVLVVAAGTANYLFGLGGATVDALIRGWASSFVYVVAAGIVVFRAVRVRDQRTAWIVLAAGLSLYGAGNVVWALFYENMAAPPIPSFSDVLWIALYPASYVGLVMLARENNRAAPAGVWLDGLIAGLGFAALGAAVVFRPVLESATGSVAGIITNLAYPVVDLLLAALVLGLFAVRGGRLDRMWVMLGVGFMLLYVADSMYVLRVAAGAVHAGLLLNVFYLSGVVFLALAAWQPQRPAAAWRVQRGAVLLLPATFVLTSVGVLLYDHFSPVGGLALGLATLTLVAAMGRVSLTFRDVRAFAVTRHEATTDDLTSLPNRRHFLRTVHEAIDTARADGGELGLLIIDLDQFKKLNDSLGHHAGDVLLRQIGPRVRGVLRDEDMLARLGGDEFGVLLPAPCGEVAALSVARRIGEELQRAFDVEGLHLHIAASVGIALFPVHSQDAATLLRHADIAMYQAKNARSGYEVYARDRDTNTRDNLQLASELPGAIAAGQLEVHFQPKADAATRQIVGLEALVRWRHPERGLLSPDAFIPLAEQAGLMRDLTRVVIARALSRCQTWRSAGHDVHVAVNVSFTDLLDAQFPLEVVTTLAQHDLDPDALIIEVTESSIMSDGTRIGDVLARISEFGVGISLDDFGTGYSSLTHLRTLPVSEVKIDRSFVKRMRSEGTVNAIVRATIRLAHDLGMRVVAEGVEDDETWETLTQLGCELIQGYALSRPLPPDEVEAFLRANAVHASLRHLAR